MKNRINQPNTFPSPVSTALYQVNISAQLQTQCSYIRLLNSCGSVTFFDSFEVQMKAETKAAEEGRDKYGLRFTEAPAALRQTLTTNSSTSSPGGPTTDLNQVVEAESGPSKQAMTFCPRRHLRYCGHYGSVWREDQQI